MSNNTLALCVFSVLYIASQYSIQEQLVDLTNLGDCLLSVSYCSNLLLLLTITTIWLQSDRPNKISNCSCQPVSLLILVATGSWAGSNVVFPFQSVSIALSVPVETLLVLLAIAIHPVLENLSSFSSAIFLAVASYAHLLCPLFLVIAYTD